MGDIYGMFLAQQRVADNVRRAFPDRDGWSAATEGTEARTPRGRELRRRVSLSLRRLADRVEPSPAYDRCVPGVGAA